MVILRRPEISAEFPCPYLPGRNARFFTVLAGELSEDELEGLLQRGWRRFGFSFFRPICGKCRECVPVRVAVRSFRASRSQQRSIGRNRDLTFSVSQPCYSEEAVSVYRGHSLERFGRTVTGEEFRESFLENSDRCLQSSYSLDGRLIGTGFLDRSRRAFSSMYFAYRPEEKRRGIGTYSVIKEIQFAASLDLDYYYLGYYVSGNRHMAYKDCFRPNEKMDWGTGEWSRG